MKWWNALFSHWRTWLAQPSDDALEKCIECKLARNFAVGHGTHDLHAACARHFGLRLDRTHGEAHLAAQRVDAALTRLKKRRRVYDRYTDRGQQRWFPCGTPPTPGRAE